MSHSKQQIIGMIAITKQELKLSKPRSRRRVELECRLRDLIVKQLRFENRIERRHAA